MRRGISPVKVLALIVVVIVALVLCMVLSRLIVGINPAALKEMVRHDILCHVYCACRIGGIPGWQVCW